MTDEQAKTVQLAVETADSVVGLIHATGTYAKNILGDLPHRAIRIFLDEIAAYREREAAKLLSRTAEVLEEKGIHSPIDPPLKLLLPIIAGGIEDNSEELREMWARLLAAAMDPVLTSGISLTYIDTLKQLSPTDALVLKLRYNHPGGLSPNATDWLTARTQKGADEIRVAIDNLGRMGCVAIKPPDPIPADFTLTSFGKELMRLCH